MVSRIVVMSGLLVSIGLWTGCGRTDSESTRIVVTGSSTVAPMLGDMARHYESLHRGVRVDVQTGGSSRGIADTRRGLADIGMVSRAPYEDEDDLLWHQNARDGIAMIVHTDNPIREIDTDTVRAIFRKEIRRWSELDGQDKPITVISKADGRSTLELFLAYTGLESAEIRADTVIGDNEHGITAVIGDPNAITYVSIGTAEYSVNEGRPLRLLPLDGISATTSRVRAGDYPLSRPLHLVTRPDPSEEVLRFIEFTQSAEAASIVEAHYFIPLSD